MSNPIKSAPIASTATTAATGTQGAGTAALPADWLARTTGERGADSMGANSFARWMSQHSQQSQSLTHSASQNMRPDVGTSDHNMANSANAPSAAKSGPGWSTTQARLMAQRSQTAMPAHAATGASKPASGSHSPTRATPSAAHTDATQQEGGTQEPQAASGRKFTKGAHETKDASRASKADGTPDAEATEVAPDGKEPNDEVRYSTALGDGSAIVRELTPPPGIQANDPAGMMAWLAQLTQTSGDAAQGGQGAGKGLDALGEEASAIDGGSSAVEGTGRRLTSPGRDLSEVSGRGAGPGLGARSAVGSVAAVRDEVALQADALLKTAAAQDAKDPAALLPADGARLAGFGQTLAEVKQSIPNAQASLPTPLDAPDFSQKLADQVSLWVGQARSEGPMTAELHLNPAEMGPIHVKISLDGQSAHVDFAATAHETRQAIQASLSMLSSSLNDVGLSLTGGGVFSQTSQQQSFAHGAGSGLGNGGGNGSGQPRGNGSGSDDDALSLRQVSAPRANRLGGLDLYA